MKERNVGALLVVDEEKLVGMLTERDFFKLM
jgi:CBS domain-containing protein